MTSGAGRPPRRNADADWDRWPVTQYLSENYHRLHACDAAVLAHHSTVYQRFRPGSLARTVELGAGPNLYPLMLAGAASRRIDAVETSAANLAYLRRQLRDGPDESWEPFYTECRRRNPDLPPTLPAALARVRVVPGDLRTAVPDGRYELASMHFVAESVTSDAAEFRQFCGNYVRAVRPGGHLVAAFMAQMPTYQLGDGSTWPGYPVDAAMLREVFAPLTEDLALTRISHDPTLPSYGDNGMIALYARRRP